MKFSEFDLNDTLLEAIYYANFDEATEIQAKAFYNKVRYNICLNII